MLEYVDAVIDVEWGALQRGEVSESVMALFQELELKIFSLEATTPMQKWFHGRLLEDIDQVSATRVTRFVHGGTGKRNPVFLYVVAFGFALTMVLLSVCPPRGKAIYFVGFYCGFYGMVIYVILGLQAYFIGIGQVTPEPLEYLTDFVRRM